MEYRIIGPQKIVEKSQDLYNTWSVLIKKTHGTETGTQNYTQVHKNLSCWMNNHSKGFFAIFPKSIWR